MEAPTQRATPIMEAPPHPYIVVPEFGAQKRLLYTISNHLLVSTVFEA